SSSGTESSYQKEYTRRANRASRNASQDNLISPIQHFQTFLSVSFQFLVTNSRSLPQCNKMLRARHAQMLERAVVQNHECGHLVDARPFQPPLLQSCQQLLIDFAGTCC